VDFLAEVRDGVERWTPFVVQPDEAVATFNRVANRPGDREVFDALRAFLAAGHVLTILLGNHDIELSLPAVRGAFENRIGASVGRGLRFVYDGEAYAVGEALIEHGNRYDPANRVNYDGLRQLRSLQSRKQFEAMRDRFSAPAGSQLVARVMNPLKSEYAFIDLLKPESEPLFALVLALDPGYIETARQIARVIPVARAYGSAIGESPALPRFGGDVGAGSLVSESQFQSDLAPSSVSSSDDALRRVLGACLPTGAIDALLEPATAMPFGAEVGIRESAIAVWSLAKLWAAGNWLKADQRLAILRDTLPAIDGDQSFERQLETAKRYIDAARVLSERHRIVVFGHTHHAKSVVLEGDALYLNCGTWANLMRFPKELFSPNTEAASAAMRAFFDDVRQNRLDNYIRFAPTYVRLDIEHNGRTHAALCDA
jgi:UDP-2,3-diacylglucosamine pyrophosphatase LpxH